VLDITYIGTGKNPMYLFLVTDSYFKKIMGYSVSETLALSGALSTLELALKNKIYKDKVLINRSSVLFS